MTDQFVDANKMVPITPPPKLVQQWWKDAQQADHSDGLPCWLNYVATQAARWGADQELKACLAEVSFFDTRTLANKLRAARRPKPPSIKEQALGALGRFSSNAHTNASQMTADFDLLRRALEQLDD